MALIDVTSLLVDPDFVDQVQIIHRTPVVNSFGENTLTEVCVNTVGSVQPASGRALQRLPEDLQVQNMSSFWIKGEIIATATGKYTDLLVFRGKRYQVVNIFDWMNYGPGYSEGLCVQEKPAE